jgi:hypothetical protein
MPLVDALLDIPQGRAFVLWSVLLASGYGTLHFKPRRKLGLSVAEDAFSRIGLTTVVDEIGLTTEAELLHNFLAMGLAALPVSCALCAVLLAARPRAWQPFAAQTRGGAAADAPAKLHAPLSFARAVARALLLSLLGHGLALLLLPVLLASLPRRIRRLRRRQRRQQLAAEVAQDGLVKQWVASIMEEVGLSRSSSRLSLSRSSSRLSDDQPTQDNTGTERRPWRRINSWGLRAKASSGIQGELDIHLMSRNPTSEIDAEVDGSSNFPLEEEEEPMAFRTPSSGPGPASAPLERFAANVLPGTGTEGLDIYVVPSAEEDTNLCNTDSYSLFEHTHFPFPVKLSL